MFVTALLGLLKSRQNSFVDKYSELVIRESTDLDHTSDDAELDDLGQESMNFVGTMVHSSNPID